MSATDATAAVARATAALPGWSATTAAERAEALRALHAGVEGEKEYLAQLITAEQGKPIAEARGEVAYANTFLRWFAEEARRT